MIIHFTTGATLFSLSQKFAFCNCQFDTQILTTFLQNISLIISAAFLSFSFKKWLYTDNVIPASACPALSAMVFIGTPAINCIVILVCLNECGCHKNRTKQGCSKKAVNLFYLKDDLIQETVLHLLKNRSQFDPTKASYETWAILRDSKIGKTNTLSVLAVSENVAIIMVLPVHENKPSFWKCRMTIY